MASHLALGKLGEELAFQFLIQNNYEILERNWRFSRAEIDLIAKIDDALVFVEVKTRSSIQYSKPEESVGQKKQNLMIDAAFVYMEEQGYDWEIRFDIVSIFKPAYGKPRIQHFKDVFF